jgi:uncharacterized protein YbjT (DUF2867 family)
MRPVLVTGGTGTLGRAVVARLTAAGTPVRVLSRRPRAAGDVADEWVVGNLRSGVGIAEAVRGVRAIVHCASEPLGDRDVAGTETLIEAARAAGAPHLVYISIVGIDLVPLPYYRTKLAVEQLIRRSGLPYSVLRATQFHDLLTYLFRLLAKLPVVLVPAGLSVQPVDVREVAERLVLLAEGEPTGRVDNMGGPMAESGAALARQYLAAVGSRRPVLSISLPGKVMQGLRAGGNLAPSHSDGQRSFSNFLAEHVSSENVSSGRR